MMKRKNTSTINNHMVGLRTPKSARKREDVIYSGLGSGAVLSNRRDRFWNT
jgi:hypothetical protein